MKKEKEEDEELEKKREEEEDEESSLDLANDVLSEIGTDPVVEMSCRKYLFVCIPNIQGIIVQRSESKKGYKLERQTIETEKTDKRLK